MKDINLKTLEIIRNELNNLPSEYARTKFNSEAEALAVIREEYMELEQEIFWGKKKAKTVGEWKSKMRGEAVQLAAMCVRFIQECCSIPHKDLIPGREYLITYNRDGIINTSVFKFERLGPNNLIVAFPHNVHHWEVINIEEK